MNKCTLPLAVLLALPPSLFALDWKIAPPQLLPDGSSARQHWVVKDGELVGNAGITALEETQGFPLPLGETGTYYIWVRYWSWRHEGTDLAAIIRDTDGEGLLYGELDLRLRLPGFSLDRGQEDGWKWQRFALVLEAAPQVVRLSLKGVAQDVPQRPPEHPSAQRRIAEILITSNSDFTPDNPATWAAWLPPPRQLETMDVVAPDGWLPSPGLPTHSSFFAGEQEPKRQFKAGVINCMSQFHDPVRMVRYGFNRDHGANQGSTQHGIRTMMDVQQLSSYPDSREYERFKNANGEVSGWLGSLSDEKLLQFRLGRLEAELAEINKNRPDAVESLSVCVENGGQIDYSATAVAAFRAWLPTRYKSVDALNVAWGTNWREFATVEPPKKPLEYKVGAWSNWLDFNSAVFCSTVAKQRAVVQRLAPDLEITQQNSNAQLLMPYLMALTPMNWEEFINTALAGVDQIGWDGYCADDMMGCDVDLLLSLADGRKLNLQEFNIHSNDPRIAARTYNQLLAKGLRGIHLFQFQHGTNYDGGPKMGMLEDALTPKVRFGAFCDSVMELHRLERLFMDASPILPTKPVMLYYSRLDFSLPQAPLASPWGEGEDSATRIYEILRGLGYPVRWITPRQILAGGLDQAGALVMAKCEHVPQAVAHKIRAYVADGGTMLSDGFPGAFDEDGAPSDILSEVTGITLAKGATDASQLKLQESNKGYGDLTTNALVPEHLYETVGEISPPTGSTHPLAAKFGSFLLSGNGWKKVEVQKGEVLGYGYSLQPGLVLNEFGKGKSLYCSLYLGSLYNGAATRHEWENVHSGSDEQRVLGAFLAWAGVRPWAISTLPATLGRLQRVEVPLQDTKGNLIVGVTSYNPGRTPAQTLTLHLPTGNIRQWLAARPGSRELFPLTVVVVGDSLRVDVPEYDAGIWLVGLADSGPLLGVEVMDLPLGAAALPIATPDCQVRVKVTLWNPSGQALPPGKVSMQMPRGWFAQGFTAVTPQLPPDGRAECSFLLRAAPIAARRDLRPLLFRWTSDDGTLDSAPATQLLWWSPMDQLDKVQP